MPALDSVKLELFIPGFGWVDISAYLNLAAGASIHIGRTSPFSAAPPGTASFVLDNPDGRFTPHRQVLADGVTVNPYWPYLVPRAQIRWSWVKGASTYRRYTGLVKGWPPSQPGGHAKVAIEATTLDDRLSRILMDAAIRQELLVDSPEFYWPLDDEAGSVAAAEVVQNEAAAINHVADAALTFGAGGPGAGNGTAVSFAPSSATVGQVLRATSLGMGNWSNLVVEAWVSPPAGGSGGPFVAVVSEDQTSGFLLQALAGGQFRVVTTGGVTVATSGVVIDGGWHHVAVSVDSSNTNVSLYVDGALVGTAAAGQSNPPDAIQIGGADYYAAGVLTHSRFTGRVGHVALYGDVYALGSTAARVLAHFSAGRDWAGVAAETVDERIARFLAYGGVAGTLDASGVVLGGYPQAGKDIVTACQDMAVTEGGGSVVYVGVDGLPRFHNRDFRTPGAADLTVDAQADLDGTNYTPAFDDTQIVNQVAGSRGTVTTTASTFTVDDLDSQAAYGLTSDSFTSYAADDADVRRNAQDRLAQQAEPAFRLAQLTLDLATSQTSTIYGDVAAVDVGSRIEATGLPPTAAPTPTLDLYAEGWTENYTADGVSITFGTSPADNPPQALYDDAKYGRYQTNDDNFLALAMSSSITTVRITTNTPSPAFTTNAAMYPMTIQIDEEHIILNTAPTGSPTQIFTGVTRGADGTPAAAHAVALPVDVVAAATYAL